MSLIAFLQAMLQQALETALIVDTVYGKPRESL